VGALADARAERADLGADRTHDAELREQAQIEREVAASERAALDRQDGSSPSGPG
jgi:hypothetical protein